MSNAVQEAVENVQDILVQIESLNDQLKELKSELKEAGLDVGAIVAVAKANISGKLTELKDKTESILSVIEQV